MNPIGHTIIRLHEVVSTNTLVMETEHYLAQHGLVVVARHQTGGRGRIGKKWVSLPGAQLQFSTVVHPKIPRDEVPAMALMAGVAVAEGLERGLGLEPTLKWPNDVLLGGKKVCGILVEMKTDSAGSPRVVVGIGINCNGSERDFPAGLRPLLTTLEHHAGGPVELDQLLGEILPRIEAWQERLDAGGKSEMLEAWQGRAHLGGRKLRYPTPQGAREGRAVGLTEEGYLLIETPGGGRQIHVSGEIEWL